MKTYYKLIRDKIPEIIQADGKTCITRILSDEEYVDALEKKLNEEVAEYQTDKNLKSWQIFWKYCMQFVLPEDIHWKN